MIGDQEAADGAHALREGAGDEIDVVLLTKPRVDKLVKVAQLAGGTVRLLQDGKPSGNHAGLVITNHTLTPEVRATGIAAE